MKPSEVLSVRDFFNYYFSGFAWLMLATVWILPIRDPTNAELGHAKAVADAIGVTLGAALVVAVPFVAGFGLNFLGWLATRLVLMTFGDPRQSVVDLSITPHLLRHRYMKIRSDTLDKIGEKIETVFGKKADPISKWFYLVRAYVINRQLPAADLATRDHLLSNLAEGLILPLPVTLLVTGIKIGHWSFPTVGLLVAAVVLFALLAQRYLYLREYWTKHVYWAFVAEGLPTPAVTTDTSPEPLSDSIPANRRWRLRWRRRPDRSV